MLYVMGSRFRYRSRAFTNRNGNRRSNLTVINIGRLVIKVVRNDCSFFFLFLLVFSQVNSSLVPSLRKFIPVEINLVIGKYEAEQIDSLLVIFIEFCTNNRLEIICEIVAFFFFNYFTRILDFVERFREIDVSRSDGIFTGPIRFEITKVFCLVSWGFER